MSTEPESGRTIKNGDTIYKGEWYYICCSEDLYESEEDFIWRTVGGEEEPRAFPTEAAGRAELATKGL